MARRRSGTIRLWYATPDWNDYVLLAFTEIRDFGARTMPVARRLRAALVELLDAAVADRFSNPAELRQALIPDRHGIGASSSREGEPEVDPGFGV